MLLQERIISGGAPGAGKTYDWATIARALPKSKFYVIDPDDGVRRVLYETINEERVFPDLSNIEYYFTPTWYTNGAENVPKVNRLDDDELKAFRCGVADAWKTIKPKVKSDDWIIVEHLGNIWARVQDGFADEVFDKDIGQYFLERRKAMKAGSKRLEALEGWTDWSVVNKLHNDDFIISVCFEQPAHVYMTTAISVIDPSRTKEETEIKAFYGDTNIRFEGQKHNPFRAQTIIIKKAVGSKDDKKFVANTFLKDRGREWMREQEISDFYYDYLVGVAGWE